MHTMHALLFGLCQSALPASRHSHVRMSSSNPEVYVNDTQSIPARNADGIKISHSLVIRGQSTYPVPLAAAHCHQLINRYVNATRRGDRVRSNGSGTRSKDERCTGRIRCSEVQCGSMTATRDMVRSPHEPDQRRTTTTRPASNNALSSCVNQHHSLDLDPYTPCYQSDENTGQRSDILDCIINPNVTP